jgi:hypothetical protein
MPFTILGSTVDQRTNANVIYCKCSVEEYLALIGDDFEGFSIQRKRESHRAYSRLKKDLIGGALIPSITLSVKHHLVDKVIKALNSPKKLTEMLSNTGTVDILDGLQRTYIIKDIKKSGHKFPDNQELLLEFWVEPNMGKLIYRMIILNAGQKAMSMKHQIELLFISMKETVTAKIQGIDIFLEKDDEKRDAPSKYSLGIIAAAYQSFMTKSTELDKANLVAEGLNRDNILDASEDELTEKFYKFLNYFKTFKDIDSLAWNYYEGMYNDVRYKILMKKRNEETLDDDEAMELSNQKAYKTGIKWFGADNSTLSLFCAISQFDDSGRQDRIYSALAKLKGDFGENKKDPFGIIKYEEIRTGINPRKSNVGQATRKLLLNGFKEYIREEGIIDMSDCWPQAAD